MVEWACSWLPLQGPLHPGGRVTHGAAREGGEQPPLPPSSWASWVPGPPSPVRLSPSLPEFYPLLRLSIHLPHPSFQGPAGAAVGGSGMGAEVLGGRAGKRGPQALKKPGVGLQPPGAGTSKPVLVCASGLVSTPEEESPLSALPRGASSASSSCVVPKTLCPRVPT